MEDAVKWTVRKLRSNQTKSEAIMWQAVRNRKLNGKKFLRQHPIRFEMDGEKKFFVADFYCHEKKLVVEIDGKIHLGRHDYDESRSYIIRELGMKIIRFRNDEVESNLDSVIERLKEHL